MKAERRILLVTLSAFAGLLLLAVLTAFLLAPAESLAKASLLERSLDGAFKLSSPLEALGREGRVAEAFLAERPKGKAYLLELREGFSVAPLSLAAAYAPDGTLLGYSLLASDSWTKALGEADFAEALKGKDSSSLPRGKLTLPPKLADAVSGASLSAGTLLSLLREGSDYAISRGKKP